MGPDIRRYFAEAAAAAIAQALFFVFLGLCLYVLALVFLGINLFS